MKWIIKNIPINIITKFLTHVMKDTNIYLSSFLSKWIRENPDKMYPGSIRLYSSQSLHSAMQIPSVIKLVVLIGRCPAKMRRLLGSFAISSILKMTIISTGLGLSPLEMALMSTWETIGNPFNVKLKSYKKGNKNWYVKMYYKMLHTQLWSKIF